MTQGDIMDVMRQTLLVCIQLAAPLLLVSIAVGLIIAIFQAATQIHEQTLTFVPKLLVIAVLLLLLGSWYSSTMTSYVEGIFDLMKTV